MADASSAGQGALIKGARITGDQRTSLAQSFGERYAGGESIRSIAQDTGRSYGFVHGVLKESGATLRGRGGATRGPRAAGAAPTTEAAPAERAPETTKTKAKKAVDKVKDVKDKVAKQAKDDKPKKKADAKKASKKGKKG
jgi:hypothetical protein